MKNIGICPKCGKNVIELPKSYSCEANGKNCDFIIWKSKAGRTISEDIAKDILEKGKSCLINDFKSKAGNTFSAYLKLNYDKEVIFDFPPKKQS